jgi:hypothetical protein
MSKFVRWHNNVVAAVAIVFALFMGFILFRDPDVCFRSNDSNWADSEFNTKGRHYDNMVFYFEAYKLHCNAPNAQLLRTTSKNWFNLFAWPNYINHVQWRLPYAEPDPAIGSYFPISGDKNCADSPNTKEEMNLLKVKSKRYIAELEKSGP